MNQPDQPCQNYKNRTDYWYSSHQCVRCKPETDSYVTFCENCYTDHHLGGYSACDHEGCPAGCKKKWLERKNETEDKK